MKIEDYEKYHQQGGTYVIPIEVFNELFGELENWKEENKRLKDNWGKLEKYIYQEQDELLKATSHTYKDSFDKVKFVNSDIYGEYLYL